MGRILFWWVLLMSSCEIQGLQHVFVLHGNDLDLDVKKSVVLDKKTDFFWKFNTTTNVGKISFNNNNTVVFDRYEGRVELFVQNYSLLLKNVQHSDSGDYTAVVVGGQDQKVAEYKVIVQDPVSPVNLTVNSIPSSSHSCNLTVTCSTVDSHISKTFRCDAQNCSQVEEKSLKPTNSFLIVYVQQDFIICNHSNHVSWEQSKKEIKPYCETNSAASIIVIVTLVGIFFLILLTVLCIVIKCKKRNMENTVCETPQDNLPDQTQNQTNSEDASSLFPTSTYALVEFHRGPETTKIRNTTQPETVYAQVNRAGNPKFTAQ